MQKYHDEPKQYKGYLKSALMAHYAVLPKSENCRVVGLLDLSQARHQ